jgi:hypothetical protein
MKKLKGIDGKLDEAWSKAIKVKAGFKCEKCGKETTLNSHHVYSRSNRSVRWDLTNGYCLCVAHHTFGSWSAHKSPLEFIEFAKEQRGEDWYNALRLKANQTMKWSNYEKEILLKALNEYIKNNS